MTTSDIIVNSTALRSLEGVLSSTKGNSSSIRTNANSYCSFVILFIFTNPVICSFNLHNNTCPHHVIIKRRPSVFGYENGLDEETHLINIMPKKLGDFQFPIAIGGHNNGNVDVAVRIGITLTVRTEHHDARLYIKTRCYDLLVSSDESDGLVAAESSSFIHCVNCLVSSIISLQACGVSVL